MNNLWKKSYCELCKNSSCSDIGRRNIHFMGHNHCSRFDDGLIPKNFVKIPEGTYTDAEGDTTKIEAFYMSKYLVNNHYYYKYILKSEDTCEDHYKELPKVNIYWREANDWAKKLGCRLPTINEWEYACGELLKLDDIDDYAWYEYNSINALHAVGIKLPNSFGLYDMLGNVWEFSSESDGENCMVRGGSFSASIRLIKKPALVPIRASSTLVGFRLVKDIEK